MVLYVETANLEHSVVTLENAILTFTFRLLSIGLEASTGKTECILFNRLFFTPGSTEATVMDQVIKTTNAVKFLEIYFDYQLFFKKQINQVLIKTSKTLI